MGISTFWKRFWVIFAYCLFLVGSGFMLTRVIPFEIQSLLPPEHPVRVEYEEYLQSFDDGRSAYILLEKQSGRFTDTEIHDLSHEVENYLSHSQMVSDYTGPANAKYLIYNNGVSLKKFFEAGNITPVGREELLRDLYRMTLINLDQSAFLVTFDFSRNLPRKLEAPELKKLTVFLKSLMLDHPEVDAHLLGTKVASAAFMDEMFFNIRVITPILLILIALFMLWLYGSLQILVWNFAVMIFCYFCTLVLIILVEGGLGPYSNFALMFSFIVATTDLIHYFCRFQRTAGSLKKRLAETSRICYVPCLLTSLCTSAGFSALIFNQNLPIRYFGLYCAFACLIEWTVIFHLLPRILVWFDFDVPVRIPNVEKSLSFYESFLGRFARAIAVSSVLVIAVGAYASQSLKVDDNFYEKFKADHPLTKAVHAFSDRFHFVGSVDVLVSPRSGLVIDAKNLDVLRDFEVKLKSLNEVTKVASYVTVKDELTHQLEIGNGSDKKQKGVNQSILSFLNDYGMFKDYYDEGGNRLRTVVFLKSFSTADFEEVLRSISSLKQNYPTLNIAIGGFANVRNYINTNVIKDFLGSFVLSFFLTYLCFLYLYRNMLWAFLALLPNMLPLVAITGLMSLFNITVDSNLAILICVAFGISGDNTIHITYLIRRLRGESWTYREKLRSVIQQIGVPVVATSGIFLFCLPVFLLGHLKLFIQMGVFLSVAFIVSFYADLFAFPAFHLIFKKRE